MSIKAIDGCQRATADALLQKLVSIMVPSVEMCPTLVCFQKRQKSLAATLFTSQQHSKEQMSVSWPVHKWLFFPPRQFSSLAVQLTWEFAIIELFKRFPEYTSVYPSVINWSGIYSRVNWSQFHLKIAVVCMYLRHMSWVCINSVIKMRLCIERLLAHISHHACTE